MTSWPDTIRRVRERAGNRCEYCLMHQALQGGTFHVEHVLPDSRGGPSVLGNLAWCCPSCNLKKSDRITVLDPKTGKTARLFHPRTDVWSEHFAFHGYRIAGITAVGRATIHALDLNNKRRVLIRQAEELFGFFPPS